MLARLVKDQGWKRGAQIGAPNATFFELLDACPDLTMIAVDRQPGDEFRAKAETYGDRAIVLEGRATDMAFDVWDGWLDFAIIADDTVKTAWAPKVRKGGAIMEPA